MPRSAGQSPLASHNPRHQNNLLRGLVEAINTDWGLSLRHAYCSAPSATRRLKDTLSLTHRCLGLGVTCLNLGKIPTMLCVALGRQHSQLTHAICLLVWRLGLSAPDDTGK